MTLSLRLTCGSLLIALAALKLIDGSAVAGDALVLSATIVEAVLGLLLVLGMGVLPVSMGVAAFGATAIVVLLIDGPTGVEAVGCGCFGALRVAFLGHLAVACAIVLLAGLILVHSGVQDRGLRQQKNSAPPG